jgi:cytochrome c oxidase cbb3-type subunit 3
MGKREFIGSATCTIAGVIFFAGLVQFLLGQKPISGASGSNHDSGKQTFAANCAACHGLDGSGTQRAPNIVSGTQRERLSSADILRIVSDGIPNKGMPSFRSLGETRLNAVVEYIRDLRGKNTAMPITGDAARGKQIFFGEAGCSNCHTVAGAGGFIAPELTAYAQTRSPEQIKSAITNPASGDSPMTVVTAITADGQQHRGVVRNEDNFSLQMQSMDGSFHFFQKSTLKRIDREAASLMPSDYGSKLSGEQLNDLLSYLMSTSNSSQPAEGKGNDKGKDEE